MFTYFHAYLPETWDAQVRAGFIDKNSGIRFCQSIDIDESKKFNVLAAKDGALFHTVKALSCPLYIDRLQGGCFIESYPYDMNLIKEYREMLGTGFYGFQMHEWASNLRSDILKLTQNGCPEWTQSAITDTIYRAFPFRHLFLEAMTAKEYEQAGKPENLTDFLDITRRLFEKRQAYIDGLLLPCDSSFQAFRMEILREAKRFMPEIGAQTADTRIQLSYARGMAKAYGLEFGTYYEPWGGSPFSACNYHQNGLNEWGLGDKNDFPFETLGGNGGSSRSLQRRLHLYSYFAGASFMAEEWGMCNTFYDWNDFELTPYGKVKYEFLEFVRKYPDIGKLITPVAVVLPKELPILETLNTADSKSYLGCAVEGSFKELLDRVRKGLKTIFRDSGEMVGTETDIMLNYNIPDAVDILHEDKIPESEYMYLVDLTGNPSFAKAHKNIIFPDEVAKKLDDILPCKVHDGIQSMVSRLKDGSCRLMILNNSGVSRTVAEGEQLLHKADRRVTVEIQDKSRCLSMLDGDGSISIDGDTAYVFVPAGGWFFGKF